MILVRRTLFPDLPGFATANSISKPYKTKSSEEYAEEGNHHYQAGEYEQAIRIYDKAIRIDPQNANTYVNRGSAYRALEKYERAISDATSAIKINPSMLLPTATAALLTEL